MTSLKELKDAARAKGLSPEAYDYITALESNIKAQRTEERFRAVYVPQVPMHALTVEVSSLEQAVIALESITALSIFEFENRVKPDYSDFGTIERWDDEEQDWEDVDEEDYADLVESLVKVGDTKQ